MISNNLYKHDRKADKEFSAVREEIRRFFKKSGQVTKVTSASESSGGASPTTAASVAYGSTNVKAALDTLMYVAPVVTSLAAIPNVAEVGSTVDDVTLNWSINKDVTSSSLTDAGDVLNLTTKALSSLGLTSDKSWTLTVSDDTSTVSRAVTLSFKDKRYWGVSANTSLTDAEVIALSSEFASSTAKKINFDCTGGKYFYIAYPASWGDIEAKVGGLSYTDWTLVQRAFVNASGHSETYNIYRSGYLQTGSNIVVEVQ